MSSCSIYTAASSSSAPIVIIDAGHGGEDSGAVGLNGVLEKDLNLQISRLIGEELTARGYNVVYSRNEDSLLYTEEENIRGIRKISDLKNRVRIFNSYNNAIVISIHMNSFSAPQYSGLQVYHSPGGEQLATAIKESVKSELQPYNKRGIKPGDKIYILKHSTNVAVLVECGFLSNRDECERLCEKEYQKMLSFSIVCGIIEYVEQNSKRNV